MSDRPNSIDRAIAQYHQVLAARKLVSLNQHILAALLGALTPAQRTELNPEILAEGETVAAHQTGRHQTDRTN